MSETATKPMSIAASFRNMWGIVVEAADRSRGQSPDARYAAMFEAANKAELWLTTKSTLGALMNTCAKKDAEISKLKSQLEEARSAAIEECVAKVQQMHDGFLSPEYATGQPASSITERITCRMIQDQISALLSAPTEARSASPAPDKEGRE